MKKNTASQVIGAQMVSATDGSAFTGAVTVYVTGDGGTQAAGSVGSGACTHEGNGYHTYAPAQAETNYDLIAFTFTGSGAVPATVQVFTDYPQTGDSYARLGAPVGASVSADIADVPTVSEFEARTLPSADYTVVSDLPSVPSAADNATAAAAAILETPANLLKTDAGGRVEVSGTKNTLDALNDFDPATETVKLASDGLDAVAITAPAGVASNFREMVVQLWRRQFRKATMTSTQLKTYADNGTTVLTTQTVSDDGTTQTQGTAT